MTLNKESLQNLADKGVSLRDMSSFFNMPLSTLSRRVKDFGITLLKSKHGKTIAPVEEKACSKCKISKPKEGFYTRKRNTSTLSSLCRVCNRENRNHRARSFKAECVEYKGGECQVCGYASSMAALDFHHIDPSKKSFAIGSCRKTKFNDDIEKELDKCALVCANCHRAIHAGDIKL